MRAAVMMAVTLTGLIGNPVTVSAQNQTDSARRTPPRIVVTPRQPAADPYPKAGPAYPGPGYVRDCVASLEEDPRPSGTVIVPRMRCGWVRGGA